MQDKLKDIISKAWLAYWKQCLKVLLDYWAFRCDLLIEDGLILKGDRITIPETLRSQIFDIKDIKVKQIAYFLLKTMICIFQLLSQQEYLFGGGMVN